MQLGKVGRCVSSKCVHKCIVDIRYSYLSAGFFSFYRLCHILAQVGVVKHIVNVQSWTLNVNNC